MGRDNSVAIYVKESLAHALLDLGKAQEAAAMLSEVMTAIDAAGADDDSAGARLRIAATRVGLARALCYLGTYGEAEALLKLAVAARRKELGDGHGGTLEAMIQAGAANNPKPSTLTPQPSGTGGHGSGGRHEQPWCARWPCSACNALRHAATRCNHACAGPRHLRVSTLTPTPSDRVSATNRSAWDRAGCWDPGRKRPCRMRPRRPRSQQASAEGAQWGARDPLSAALRLQAEPRCAG